MNPLHDDVLRNAAEAFRETGVQLKLDSTSQADALDTGAPAVPAWEQIEAGRYMPRRIRGSYRGRELG